MNGPPRKILVVDDEKLIQRMTRFILERSNYEVHVANDGKEALRLARDVRPNLILLDVQLPHMDGFDVLTVLRQSPDMREIPVIMLSSLAETTDKSRGLGLGASEYLTKPYEPADLLACVSRYIR